MNLQLQNSLHQLSLKGVTGVLLGLLFTGYLFLLKFLLNNYQSGDGGLALLPISFFEIIIALSIPVFCLIAYLAVTLINKRRLKRVKTSTQWKTNAKSIRMIFLSYTVIVMVSSFYLFNNGFLDLIFPMTLLLYGVVLILSSSLTNGNTKLLGFFFVLQSVISVFSPSNQFLLMIVSFGGFHIVYGIFQSISSR